jgi:hypothetical protein
VAQTFRTNPGLDVEQALTGMGVGEALVSTLQQKGIPGMVDRCLICPPTSRIGSITDQERSEARSRSPIGSRYDTPLDRESAAELLLKRAEKVVNRNAQSEAQQKPEPRRSSNRQSATEAAAKSFLRSVSTTLGREIMRGILGAIRKGR